MRKLILLILIFLLAGVFNLPDNLEAHDDDGGLQTVERLTSKADPGDGGMGSWK